jgi:16S rRNA processing protein RimM
MEEYRRIGQVKKPHGLHGEVKLFLEPGYESLLEEVKAIFLGEPTAPLPYFIEHFRQGASLILKLEEVDNRETAELLRGKDLYLRESDVLHLEPRMESSTSLVPWKGWELIDQDLGSLGPIREIREYPFQVMAVVEKDEKEILIPLVEELILEVREEEGQILMNLPEGLLDLQK